MFRLATIALLLTATPAVAEQLTVRCTAEATYFLTFDTATNRMLWQAHRGMTYPGRIKAVTDAEIVFNVYPGVNSVGEATFRRKEARVLMDKSDRLFNCEHSPTRDIDPRWDKQIR